MSGNGTNKQYIIFKHPLASNTLGEKNFRCGTVEARDKGNKFRMYTIRGVRSLIKNFGADDAIGSFMNVPAKEEKEFMRIFTSRPAVRAFAENKPESEGRMS